MFFFLKKYNQTAWKRRDSSAHTELLKLYSQTADHSSEPVNFDRHSESKLYFHCACVLDCAGVSGSIFCRLHEKKVLGQVEKHDMQLDEDGPNDKGQGTQ